MTPLEMNRIEPRSGVALKLAKGETLVVSDPKGGQVSDLVCYGADDIGEVISNGRTFDYEETIALTTGSKLWSNRSRVMLEIVEDTVGTHDFLLTPCSVDTFRHFYPDKPEHRGCFGKSSGGYGAIIHGMTYAKYWGAIADHSGDAYFDFVYWHDWPNTLNELAKYRVPKPSLPI